jgi:NADH:ubiquinone oxidoreductase subunit D
MRFEPTVQPPLSDYHIHVSKNLEQFERTKFRLNEMIQILWIVKQY